MPKRRQAPNFQNQRAKAARQRLHETNVQRDHRLAQMATANAIAIANENAEQRSVRLARLTATHAIAFANENAHQRSVRLARLSANIAIARKRETPIQASQRLQVNANYRANVRGRGIDLTRAVATRPVDETILDEHNCGTMNVRCTACNSKNFADEQTADREGRLQLCCHKGKVKLNPLTRIPDELMMLLKGQGDKEEVKNFQDHIRSYNSAFAFVSMGANVEAPPGYGPYCFRIHGQIYHRAGVLHPERGEKRKFAQLYILDAQDAADQRMSLPENAGCLPSLMTSLGYLIGLHSDFARSYKMLHQVETEALEEARRNGIEPSTIMMAIRQDRKDDTRRYNAPRVTEVAVIFQNNDGEPPLERDLLIHLRTDPNDPAAFKTKRVGVLNPNLDPLTYPLLFPMGDQGWHSNLMLEQLAPARRPTQRRGTRNVFIHEGNETDRPYTEAEQNKRVTQMAYYGHRLALREEFNPLLNAGKLTQQYIVDSYVRTEANRLNFVQFNQKKLRVELYKGLADHIDSRAQAEGLVPGKPIILPSSFGGSPRNMQQNYQDAMAIVKKYGKPDLFITMTCNPKWGEISENMEPWQKDKNSSEHRPDLVARVFKMKLKALLDDITTKQVLGIVIAKIHVIEFQKRGLPHAHILIILHHDYKPRDKEQINKLVSAELPDKNTNPKLYEIVLKNMIHGPCGSEHRNSPCMVNGKCSKGFPKPFKLETHVSGESYPEYRRRNDGLLHQKGNKTVDNRWVVPYNPYLSYKYNCHINVEICSTVKSVKYLFKYVYKGHDCANVEIQEKGSTLEHNEVKTFMDSRYVSAPEAIWRLFGYKMHDQSHSIMRLAVHDPETRSIVFHPDQINEALNNADSSDSTLTAWFKLNEQDHDANQYLYHEIPKYYVFNDKKKWQLRQRGGDKVIGRMYAVGVQDVERYFMRLMLLHIRGAISFECLRTVDGIVYETYREAASKMGLLESDEVWEETMNDATVWAMPSKLRDMFATICAFNVMEDYLLFWNNHKAALTEDFRHRHQCEAQLPCKNCDNDALRDIQGVLILHGKFLEQLKLPVPPRFNMPDPLSEYNIEAELLLGNERKELLNEEQKLAFDTIIDAVNDTSENAKCFYLDGPGGSGKTYLYETLLCVLRGAESIALPVASTGIAANLLKGGRTYHSQYKLPVPLVENSRSSLKLASNDAAVIRAAKLLIWDESTMAPSHALNAVDALLKEVMDNDIPFGGKVMLLGGDFRQCLPVVPHAHQSAIVESSIKFSPHWPLFKVLKLKINVRSEDEVFSNWLIELGNGTLSNSDNLDPDMVEIPKEMLSSGNLIKDIFGDKLTIEDIPALSKRAILCPLNEDVDGINDKILDILEGESRTYYSVDSMNGDDPDEINNYPIEYLNTLKPAGMAPHELKLKKGAIIMLLRNLNSKKGLCNGTRLIVDDLKPNLILATVLTGSAEGEKVFIPRIDLAPTDVNLPFVLKRRQFPVKLAFAMTINKSQGQTLAMVGIYLPSPVFGHGQLYVAISRVRRAVDVKIQVVNSELQGELLKRSPKVFTRNVVYREIFGM